MIGGYIVCRTLYQLPILLHIKDKYVIVLPTSRQQLQHYYQLQHISHLARKHIDKAGVKRNYIYIDLVTIVISTGFIFSQFPGCWRWLRSAGHHVCCPR